MSCDHQHHHHHDHHHKYVIIRNPKSGLVLDGSEYVTKIQHFTGCDHQLWILEPIDYGRFIIINKANGNVLDVENGIKNGARLIIFKKHGGANQQWYINSDQTIVSSTGNLAVDINAGGFHPGNHLIAWTKHSGENQRWLLQYHCNV